MSIPATIFKCALNAEQSLFKTLRGIIPLCGNEIEVRRTSLFAEAQVVLADWGLSLIFMPLRHYDRAHVELLANLKSEYLCPYILLQDELSVVDSNGKRLYSDIIVQPIPHGELLRYTIVSGKQMADMIDCLHSECKRLNFSHNNLTPDNIIVGNDGRLHPIRYHYATLDGCFDNFELLKSEFAGEQTVLHDVDSLYMEDCELEGPTRFCRNRRYGFMNSKKEVVIPPQYLWAEEFCENRAVVETRTGYGVIDETGKEIISSVFDYIRYDKNKTLFYVTCDHQTACIDYNGRIISKLK